VQLTDDRGRTTGTPRKIPPAMTPRSTTLQRVILRQCGHRSAMSAVFLHLLAVGAGGGQQAGQPPGPGLRCRRLPGRRSGGGPGPGTPEPPPGRGLSCPGSGTGPRKSPSTFCQHTCHVCRSASGRLATLPALQFIRTGSGGPEIVRVGAIPRGGCLRGKGWGGKAAPGPPPEPKQRLCPGGRCAVRACASFRIAASWLPSCAAWRMPVTLPSGVPIS
jgi:hypothetical protein